MIRKEGLTIHPSSEECKTTWKTIQTECNLQMMDSVVSIPIDTCEDDVFDPSSSNHRKFDSVRLINGFECRFYY